LTRDQHGQVAGLEAVVFGMLIFVFGTLLVANAWGVIDAKLAVTSAARQAARGYVESSTAVAADAAAAAAARDALEGYGREWARADVDVTGTPFGRCARVMATVRYRVPVVVVPFVARAGTGFTVRADHSEIVDPYRSGLGDEARCAP